ncbi:MAG: DUF1566 domain-containing protein [Candidatus Brocadiaceae bacterium]|nr:DUF1566 domain-containing protein [Candidatus Brocadiaceae bacterium]
MKNKNSKVFLPRFLFILGTIFLVSEDNAQARNLNYYKLSGYESRVQFIKQEAWKSASKKTPRMSLRSSYRNLSLSQVHSLPYVSLRKKDEWGFYGYSTVDHNYEKKSINGDSVVIDHTTGLMWHQSGSSDYISWNGAKDWIRNLNNRGYAGYKDWRLPTLEEAVSQLEPQRRKNLYVDPVFHDEQWGIWTGDIHGSDGAWSVYFSLGNVRWNVKNRFVRPVRLLNDAT